MNDKTQNTTTPEQRRMAMIIGFNPASPETWPISTIERLIDIEKNEGQEKLLEEIRLMNTPPYKGRAEVIADLVVQKLMEKGIMK